MYLAPFYLRVYKLFPTHWQDDKHFWFGALLFLVGQMTALLFLPFFLLPLPVDDFGDPFNALVFIIVLGKPDPTFTTYSSQSWSIVLVNILHSNFSWMFLLFAPLYLAFLVVFSISSTLYAKSVLKLFTILQTLFFGFILFINFRIFTSPYLHMDFGLVQISHGEMLPHLFRLGVLTPIFYSVLLILSLILLLGALMDQDAVMKANEERIIKGEQLAKQKATEEIQLAKQKATEEIQLAKQKATEEIQRVKDFISQIREGIPVSIVQVADKTGVTKERCEQIITELISGKSPAGEYLELEGVFIKSSTTIEAIDRLLEQYEKWEASKDSKL